MGAAQTASRQGTGRPALTGFVRLVRPESPPHLPHDAVGIAREAPRRHLVDTPAGDLEGVPPAPVALEGPRGRVIQVAVGFEDHALRRPGEVRPRNDTASVTDLELGGRARQAGPPQEAEDAGFEDAVDGAPLEAVQHLLQSRDAAGVPRLARREGLQSPRTEVPVREKVGEEVGEGFVGDGLGGEVESRPQRRREADAVLRRHETRAHVPVPVQSHAGRLSTVPVVPGDRDVEGVGVDPEETPQAGGRLMGGPASSTSRDGGADLLAPAGPGGGEQVVAATDAGEHAAGDERLQPVAGDAEVVELGPRQHAGAGEGSSDDGLGIAGRRRLAHTRRIAQRCNTRGCVPRRQLGPRKCRHSDCFADLVGGRGGQPEADGGATGWGMQSSSYSAITIGPASAPQAGQEGSRRTRNSRNDSSRAS
jgi:hypothetical protein